MLALFRNNLFTTTFTLALYVVVLRFPAMFGLVEPPASMGGGGGLLFQDWFGWLAADARRSAIAAAVLVFVQALLLNRLADVYRLMNDRNWIPGMMYVLTASAIPDFLFISPALVAVTVVPVALHRLFSVYKQSQAFGAVFDTAFWITLGCLFYPPMVWIVPASYFGFFSLRSFSTREQVVFFIGIFVPLFLVFTSYFWFGKAGMFGQEQFGNGLQVAFVQVREGLYSGLKTGVLIGFLAIVFLGVNIYYHKRLIQVQKSITLLFWVMLAGLLATVFHSGAHLDVFMLLIPSIALFFSYLFQSSRNTFITEVFHLALVGVLFFLQFYPNA